MKRFLTLVLALLFLQESSQATVPIKATLEVEIIFDATKSMLLEVDGKVKLQTAKDALNSLADKISQDSRVGLRVLGWTPHTDPASCQNTELIMPINDFNKETMVNQVASIDANGYTPLGLSLESAAKDFTPGNEVKRTIILISDGQDTCKSDPVEIVKKLKDQGITFTIHVIGFDVNDTAREELQQLAALTDGKYYSAANASEFQETLIKVSEESFLLRRHRREVARENILSAANGARIAKTSQETFARMIDGKEEKVGFHLNPKDYVVFSFKDQRAVMLDMFSLPIFEANNNPEEMVLEGSLEGEDGPWMPVARITVKNEVKFDNVYQEFSIDPPVALRYLKVVPSVKWTTVNMYEWKAYGKFLTESELKEALDKQKKVEMNLLAKNNGGQLIASSTPAWVNLIDGGIGDSISDSGKKLGHPKKGEEGIFAFRNNDIGVLTKCAVPIFKQDQYNLKKFEVSVSLDSPTGEFTKVGEFEIMNLTFADKPYQEFKFKEPVRAKYVKIKFLEGYSNLIESICEFRVFGTLE